MPKTNPQAMPAGQAAASDPAPEPDDPAARQANQPPKPAAEGKTPRKPASELPGKRTASAKGAAKGAAGGAAGKARRPSRKTFLVAVTRAGADGASALQVYAAVTRSPAEALAAVRGALGPEVAVELTGKLSNRMAKSLGLKPDEVRAI